MVKTRKATSSVPRLEKCPTGIAGLDEITEGGLPRGRPTLVCGAAGCGKTLLAMEFIVRGIVERGEPGVFLSFEETAEELAKNVASLGFDVDDLVRRKKMAMDYVRIERSEIQETGEYDLEGLFVRLAAAVDSVGAKRVALDSVEALFAGLPSEAILRAELRRLFRWLKDRGLTAVITGEKGDNALTRHGLEEYVSDCILFLDHRVINQVATRRLRVIKYRGSKHGTNEYPTLIDEHGLSVLPISSLGLSFPVSQKRVSTGVPRLDTMLGGHGYYLGASVLISGMAGTGKTSLAAAFADDTCRGGRRCLYFSFEESPEQIVRNMRSIGFDLENWRKKGLLRFCSVRPTLYGLEMHLAAIHKLVRDFEPRAVVMDPITNMMSIGQIDEVKAMLTRVIDFLKGQGITSLFTSLTGGGSSLEQSEVGISSLMDTWLLVRMMESAGERNRLLYVMKSRGMAHSNQMREFVLADDGISLIDVYVGPGDVLTGSARLMQEAKDQAEALAAGRSEQARQRELEREAASLEAQASSIAARLAAIEAERRLAREAGRERQEQAEKEKRGLAAARKADRARSQA
ncbi:MAG: circadian clock protein KaiC [Candidatus Riflebacteria bacterium]|nr:circadian clock protein KaiC [Candidatus Riflebacteria bacterium]